METTKVAHQWIQKGNEMDRIVVVSSHSKNTYKNTPYVAGDKKTGQEFELKLNTEYAASKIGKPNPSP